MGTNGSTHIIAIDGGTTHSRGALFSRDGALVSEIVGRPANPSELGIDTSVAALSEIIRRLCHEQPGTIVAGISGAARRTIRDEVARQLGVFLRAHRVLITDDLHPLMIANAGSAPGLLAIAGTGSSVIAQGWHERWLIVGGRGRVFGDFGSAYAITVAALRAAGNAIDGTGPATGLVNALQAEIGVQDFGDIVPWSLRATKQMLAALAPVVDSAARQGDPVAVACIKEEALHLADQVWTAALKVRAEEGTPVFVHGGVFENSRLFRHYFDQAIESAEPRLVPTIPEILGPKCVVPLAFLDDPLPDWISCWTLDQQQKVGMPATEALAAHGEPLDTLSPLEIVQRMNEHDHAAADAVKAASRQIGAAIEAAARAIASGGRLIYIGAGTSGRIGVLDASECGPTFGLGQDRVMGIIAGGARALRESIEGAEDDVEAGKRDIREIKPPPGHRDVVVGIAASGATPYSLAALYEAKSSGTRTVFICCSAPVRNPADILIDLATGPEVLPGSTRLKAGTATKMVLNMISTGAMALSGYVYKGLMVGMRPVNAKLWDRATRIVSALTGRPPGAAATLLREADGRIPVAILMANFNTDAAEAIKKLKSARGNLREALARK